MVDRKSAPEAQSYSSIQAKRRLDDARRLLATGSISESQKICRDLLDEHPEYVSALCTLGQSYIANRQFKAAMPCFVRASMLCPDEPSILIRLAEMYFHLYSDPMALDTANFILTLNPDEEVERDTHLLLGQVYRNLNDFELAVSHLSKASSLAGGSSDAVLELGACYVEIGDANRANTAFAKALAGNISSFDRVHAFYGLSRVLEPKSAKKLLKDIDALEKEGLRFENDVEGVLYSALLDSARATALEKSEQHENAWKALEKANDQLRTHNSGPYKVASQSEAYTLDRASSWKFAGPPVGEFGDDLPLTLLIVGASMSGKSTLERLIGALPGSEPGYDSELVQEATRQTSTANGYMALSYPDQLPPVQHRQFTQNYAKGVTARARGAKVFTTTHPDLIPDLGQIAGTVPNLKIIFIERNADDTAFRLFGKIYPPGISPHSSAVSSIYEHLDGYSKLMDAWGKTIPDLTMRVRYEDMIGDPKAILAQVAKFCGLPAPKGKLPDLADDRDCAQPYLEFLQSARSTSSDDTLGGHWVSPKS
jgi:tetratricopeptide (TPR) repeat protein